MGLSEERLGEMMNSSSDDAYYELDGSNANRIAYSVTAAVFAGLYIAHDLFGITFPGKVFCGLVSAGAIVEIVRRRKSFLAITRNGCLLWRRTRRIRYLQLSGISRVLLDLDSEKSDVMYFVSSDGYYVLKNDFLPKRLYAELGELLEKEFDIELLAYEGAWNLEEPTGTKNVKLKWNISSKRNEWERS